MTLTNEMRGRNLGDVRALAWSARPSGHHPWAHQPGTGFQVLGSTRSRRPIRSRDAGHVTPGSQWEARTGTGCRARLTQDVLVSLSQCPDLLRPARRHSDLPRRDYGLTSPRDIFILVFCQKSLHPPVISSEPRLCLARAAVSGPGPETEPSCSDVGDGKQQRVHSEKIF